MRVVPNTSAFRLKSSVMFSTLFRSETPISAMGEDSNHSVMSDSQDGTNFKINPASSGPKELSKE